MLLVHPCASCFSGSLLALTVHTRISDVPPSLGADVGGHVLDGVGGEEVGRAASRGLLPNLPHTCRVLLLW